jgi:hypothetical protein
LRSRPLRRATKSPQCFAGGLFTEVPRRGVLGSLDAAWVTLLPAAWCDRGASVAVRVLLVLVAFVVLCGCGRASSLVEQLEKEYGADHLEGNVHAAALWGELTCEAGADHCVGTNGTLNVGDTVQPPDFRLDVLDVVASSGAQEVDTTPPETTLESGPVVRARTRPKPMLPSGSPQTRIIQPSSASWTIEHSRSAPPPSDTIPLGRGSTPSR